MAIVINGSGTVTGLSVGGLPDGTVDADTLATDSVTTAKIAANSVDSSELIDGAVDNSHMAAMAASKLTGALPAISGASLTNLPAGGITEADQWRITSNLGLNNDALTWVTANWERADVRGSNKLGTGMSESSGVFSFPSTGMWMILLQTKIGGAADARYVYATINTTTNDGTYYEAAAGTQSINQESSYWYSSQNCNFIFDVTNTATHKVKMKMFSITNDISLYGSSSEQLSGLTFIKLGET